jgi:membrane protease YdiL (CAAX protease family)
MSGRQQAPNDLPLGVVLALHLLPGAALMGAYVLLAPPLLRQGVPSTLAFLLAGLLAGLPCMLVVLRAGRRWGGIRYREPMPARLYAAFYLAGLALAFALLFATAPLCKALAEGLRGWLPDYLLPGWQPPAPPERSLVLVALVLQVVVDGVAAPVVEELYFRGLLLPRLGRLGALAPAANALLFTVQHFWQPFNWPLILLLNLPVAYLVWWRRNIYIAMLLHCSTNFLGATLALLGFLFGW